MQQKAKIWALLMLANELAANDYAAKYGDYSAEESDDFVMTDEVDAVITLANSGETLDKVQDLEQFLIDFFDKADRAGWELPWADAYELLAAAEAGAADLAKATK